MGIGRGGDHLAQAQLAGELRDALTGTDRTHANRTRLLADLADPGSSAFDRAVLHLVRTMAGHPPAPQYAARQQAIRQLLRHRQADELVALATMAIMLAIRSVEEEQAASAPAAGSVR